jgi:predicted metal-dependent HD superfamily phosphohydrolase
VYHTTMLERLKARYAEPHRRYHTWSHVEACLEARKRIAPGEMPAVDLALLFHDAIYDPRAHDNEERSAELMVEEARRDGHSEAIIQRAVPLVLATKHAMVVAETEEARIVVDADLSILGADEGVFNVYDRAIREEYAFVDDAAYAAGRAAVLGAFLARAAIYGTPAARDLWEDRARKNLARARARL